MASLITTALAAAHAKKSTSCPTDFRNCVFNAGVNEEPDFSGRFSTLQSVGGISKWIGFTDEPPSNGDDNIDANQLRIVMDPTHVQEAVGIVTSSDPPDYIEIFNEPDFSYAGQTPLTSPADAASAVQPLLDASTSTVYISPAPAFPDSNYLPEFFGNCSCLERFPIIAAHIYNPDPNVAISLIETVHSQFPDQRLWITEIAPASGADQGCTLDSQGVIDWQNTVLTWAAQSGYVDRVFWNSGEYGSIGGSDPAVCNPSLTNNDTTPTALLENLGSLCG